MSVARNPFEPVPGKPRRLDSDLVARIISAIAMVAVAIFALWMGGRFFTFFALVLAGGLMWEWTRVVHYMGREGTSRIAWLMVGMVYIGWATATLLAFVTMFGMVAALFVLASVWAVDVGAYIAGRMIGGPKIAPAISPSKTWAGLGGGVVAATLWLWLGQASMSQVIILSPLFGIIIAVIAQAGDFFESWMKRQAGLKDSSNLIPGHGGIFDRLDGLIPVLIMLSFLIVFDGIQPDKLS